MIVEDIRALIIAALGKLQFPEVSFALEHPDDLSHGDFASNIAMVLGKKIGKNPKEVAQVIAAELNKIRPETIEKIEIAGAGFVNFFLSENFLKKSISEIIEAKDDYGKTKIFSGRKFFVEHTQPNPFKEFHIGHLMNNSIGEAIARIIKANGAEVKTATYHGDAGLHVAKALWSLLRTEVKELTVSQLGKAYAEGNTAYEGNEEAKKEIVDINKKIYGRSDQNINDLYDMGRKISLDYFESLYRRMGSHFDFHFYESEAGERGKMIVLDFLDKKVFAESEGAVVFKGEEYGLHTRVFLNSEKLPTYEGKEVGLAILKKEAFPYDYSITVTANEQDAFFDVVEVAIGEIFPELKGKLRHLSHGVMKLPSGKMSSRTGTIVSAENLIDQVKEKVLEKISEHGFSPEDKDTVAEQVAIGAIKYSILRQGIGGDIIFDFDKSLSFEGDSGPYLQYTAVRAKSVLDKAKEVGLLASVSLDTTSGDLERTLYRFPELVARAGKENAPHIIVTFLTEVASLFNAFYANNKIIEGGEEALYRLTLTEATRTVLKNGLYILGIPLPEKM